MFNGHIPPLLVIVSTAQSFIFRVKNVINKANSGTILAQREMPKIPILYRAFNVKHYMLVWRAHNPELKQDKYQMRTLTSVWRRHPEQWCRLRGWWRRSNRVPGSGGCASDSWTWPGATGPPGGGHQDTTLHGVWSGRSMISHLVSGMMDKMDNNKKRYSGLVSQVWVGPQGLKNIFNLRVFKSRLHLEPITPVPT